MEALHPLSRDSKEAAPSPQCQHIQLSTCRWLEPSLCFWKGNRDDTCLQLQWLCPQQKPALGSQGWTHLQGSQIWKGEVTS